MRYRAGALLAMAVFLLALPLSAHSAGLVRAQGQLLGNGQVRFSWEDDCATYVIIERINPDGTVDTQMGTAAVPAPGAWHLDTSGVVAPQSFGSGYQWGHLYRISGWQTVNGQRLFCWQSPVFEPTPFRTYLPEIAVP